MNYYSNSREYRYNWIGFAISLVVCLALFAGIWYLTLPAWNLHSVGLWFFVIIGFAACSIIPTAIGGTGNDEYLPTGISAIISGVLLVILIICACASGSLFHKDTYRAAAEITASENLVEELPNTLTMPVIDRATAQKLGDRTMGAMEEYLSQYEVSTEYNLMDCNNEGYYVSPLEYGSFFKFNNSRDVGIPAYVKVHDTTGQPEIIKLEEGHEIRYAPSAFWNYDLTRHLRFQYPGKIFGNENFEVDDNGHPYYIVPTLKSTAGLFGAQVIDTVIVLDAHSGESKEYAKGEEPEWVDNVSNVNRVMKQVNWNYSLIHGVFNFSDKDVRKTSYSFDNSQFYCFIKDNHTWVYTGVTSAGGDESNIGCLLINLKTEECYYFGDPGAEESSAQESAKGLVQQYGYSAGPVMLVNVAGHQTYFCTLKDAQMLVKKYALVNKTDYTKVVVEDTIEQAIATYTEKMDGSSNNPSIETPEAYTAEGIVTEVYEVTVDGNTMFIFYLEGKDELFVSAIGNNFEQPRKLQPSAVVAITYSKVDDTNVISEITFK